MRCLRDLRNTGANHANWKKRKFEVARFIIDLVSTFASFAWFQGCEIRNWAIFNRCLRRLREMRHHRGCAIFNSANFYSILVSFARFACFITSLWKVAFLRNCHWFVFENIWISSSDIWPPWNWCKSTLHRE